MSDPDIFTALSIWGFLGIWTWVGYIFSRLVSLSLSVCSPFSSGESMRCLIFCLSFEILGLEFLFITLLWPPSESAIGEKNLCHLPYLLVVWVVSLV